MINTVRVPELQCKSLTTSHLNGESKSVRHIFRCLVILETVVIETIFF